MKKIIAALALSTFVAAPALAAGFNQDNLYAGAQVASNSCSGCNSLTGFGALVGYTIDKQWAVEGSYNSLGSDSIVKVSSMAATGVFSYPIKDQIKAIGKIGLASVSSEVTIPQICGFGTCFGGGTSTVSKSGLTYGIGGEYAVDKQISVRAGFDVYAMDGGNLNSLYVGGIYNF